MNRTKLKEGINFFIHDLHPYGGQDRSTLEILNQLSEEMPVHVYAFSLQNPAYPNSKIQFHPCPIRFRRPVLLKSLIFHIWSLWKRFTSPRRLTLATGTCSLWSDIVHVQFVAKAWKREKRKLLLKKSGIMRFYHLILAFYNEWMETLIFKSSRSYAAISSSVAIDLKEHFPVSDVRVIHHGVDLEKFAPPIDENKKRIAREQLGLPADKFIFVFVGAYDRKGLAAILLAANSLKENTRHFCIVAVGDGSQASYREMAGGIESTEWLILHGPSKNIESYYHAADAFVLPTLYEPFGLVILEAMSSGLPVITSKCAGASELVSHQESGLLLNDPTDIATLSKAMEKLIEDPSLCASMGKKARSVAEGRSWKKVASEFNELIGKESRLRGFSRENTSAHL